MVVCACRRSRRRHRHHHRRKSRRVTESVAETREIPVPGDPQQQQQQRQEALADNHHPKSDGVGMSTLPRALSPVKEESDATETENPMKIDMAVRGAPVKSAGGGSPSSMGEDSSRFQDSVMSAESPKRWEGEEDEETGGMFADADVVARLAAAAAQDAFSGGGDKGTDVSGSKRFGSGSSFSSSSSSRWRWNHSGSSWVHQMPIFSGGEKPVLGVKTGRVSPIVAAAASATSESEEKAADECIDSTVPSPSVSSTGWMDVIEERFGSGQTDPEVQSWLSVFAGVGHEGRGLAVAGGGIDRDERVSTGQWLAMEEKREGLEEALDLPQVSSAEGGENGATPGNPPLGARVPPHSPLLVDGGSPRVFDDAEFVIQESLPVDEERGVVSEPECEVPEPATTGPGVRKIEGFSGPPLVFHRDLKTIVAAKGEEKEDGEHGMRDSRSLALTSSVAAVRSRETSGGERATAAPVAEPNPSPGSNTAAIDASTQRVAGEISIGWSREGVKRKHIAAGPENLEAPMHLPPKAQGSVQRRVLLTPRSCGGVRGFNTAAPDRLPVAESTPASDLPSNKSWLAPLASPDSRPLRVSEVVEAFEKLSPRRKNLTPPGLGTPAWSTPVATPDRSLKKRSKSTAPGKQRRGTRPPSSEERLQTTNSRPREGIFKPVAPPAAREQRFEPAMTPPPRKTYRAAVVPGWTTPVATPDRHPTWVSKSESGRGRNTPEMHERTGHAEPKPGPGLEHAPATWTPAASLPPTDVDSKYVGQHSWRCSGSPAGVDGFPLSLGKDCSNPTDPQRGTTSPATSADLGTLMSSNSAFLTLHHSDGASFRLVKSNTGVSSVPTARVFRKASVEVGVQERFGLEEEGTQQRVSRAGVLSSETGARAMETEVRGAGGESMFSESVPETRARVAAGTSVLRSGPVAPEDTLNTAAEDGGTRLITRAKAVRESKDARERRGPRGGTVFQERMSVESRGNFNLSDIIVDRVSNVTSLTAMNHSEGSGQPAAQKTRTTDRVSGGATDPTLVDSTPPTGASKHKDGVLTTQTTANRTGVPLMTNNKQGDGHGETDASSEAAAVAALVAEAMALADENDDRLSDDVGASVNPMGASQWRSNPTKSISDLVAAERKFASSKSLLSWKEGEPIEDGDAERDAVEVQALVAEALALVREADLDDDFEDA